VRAVRAAAGDSLHVIHVYARGRAAVSLTRPSTHGENGKTHTHPPVSAGLLPHFRKETPPHYHPWDGGICNLRRICSPGQSGRICKSVPTWRRFTVVLLLDGMMSRTRLARRVGWLSKSDRDFRQGRGGRGNEAQVDTRDGLAYVTRDGLAYVSCKARSTRPSAASPSPPVHLITNYLSTTNHTTNHHQNHNGRLRRPRSRIPRCLWHRNQKPILQIARRRDPAVPCASRQRAILRPPFGILRADLRRQASPLASPPSSLTPLSNRLLPTAFSQRAQISAQRNHHLRVLGLP
jgi:hypothetical protein